MSRKVALVTGSGKRVGRAIALHLAARGYDQAIHYHSSENEAVEVKALAESLGVQAVTMQEDLSALHAGHDLIEKVRAAFGRLDLLVNCASTFPNRNDGEGAHKFQVELEEEWEDAIAVNTRAPFFLMRHGLALMSEGGTIINILDTSAEEEMPSRAAHAVSKAALGFITRLAAKSFPPSVRTVSLMLRNIIPGEQMSEETIRKMKWTPIEEVLRAVDKILSGAIQNGETLHVR